MEMCTSIILYGILIILPFLYWYSTRKFKYWSDRGIKGPRPWPIMGNFVELFLCSRRSAEINMLKKHGKIYGIYNGNSPVLTVAEPKLIKDIFVKDFHIFTNRQMPGFFQNHPILSKHLGFVSGQDWKRLRSIVSPTFTSGKMRKMYPMIKECLNELLEVLDNYERDDHSVNMKELFSNFTMDVIATCAFATKINAHKDPNNPFVENAKKVFNPKNYRLIPLLIFPNFLLKLLNLKNSTEESANEFYFNLTRHIINQRKSSDKKHNDFIDLLLNAQKNSENISEDVIRDDNDLNESHHVNEGEEELEVEKRTLSGVTKIYITENEILAQAWAFFLAGYETTTTTLTFASYELALNQDIQQRLYGEVMSCVDTNGDIDYDLLSKLPFLDSIISETLRLHSPAVRLTRKASEDYKLGTTGITIEKDHSVEIPIYAIHRSEEFYENADQFNPDRFMPENSHKLIPYTYLPFGSGPRSCIGMRFALMEAKLCLAQMIKRFRLIRCDQTEVPPIFKDVPGLNSPKRLILGIEKRL